MSELLLLVVLALCCFVHESTGFMNFGNAVRRRSSQVKSDKSALFMAAPTTEPPKSFLDCVSQSVKAVDRAIADGTTLLEVEFPPLPLSFMDDSSSSARDIADASTRWAVDFAKQFSDRYKVSIIYPDQPELESAIKFVDEPGVEKPYPNVTLATIRADSIKNAKSLDQVLLSVFGATVGGKVEAVEGTEMYVALVTSTQELPDLEKLHNLDKSIPIIFFNLRLDILRGDLGLPLFPGRDLHHRFLSRVKPAYLMRSRSFATSLRKPPFLVNYSGLLFRAYPEPFQCVLDIGDNKSKMVKFVEEKPTNMAFRKALTEALVVPGVSKEELVGNAGNLVWWEKEVDKEESDAWRT